MQTNVRVGDFSTHFVTMDQVYQRFRFDVKPSAHVKVWDKVLLMHDLSNMSIALSQLTYYSVLLSCTVPYVCFLDAPNMPGPDGVAILIADDLRYVQPGYPYVGLDDVCRKLYKLCMSCDQVRRSLHPYFFEPEKLAFLA